MQTQQTRRLQVLPVQIMALAIALFIALMLAGSFGYWLKGLSVSPATHTTVQLGAVGTEQLAHNRSEEGYGVVNPVSAQQIAHNRSEEGLTKPGHAALDE